MTLGTEVSHVIYRIPSRRSMVVYLYESSWSSQVRDEEWDCPCGLPHMGDCPLYGHYSPLHIFGKMRLKKLGWKGIAYFQTNIKHVRNSILVGKKSEVVGEFCVNFG